LDLDKAGGSHRYFEACLPVEIIAQRSAKALTFGPMSPAGLTDPRTGRWPHAVVQLRQDNLAASLYNLVGFQTNLCFTDQQRVFRMIPGLEKAEFVRYGQMHRNTFISSPKVLDASMQFRARSDLFFAGQITGMEGYAGSIASGLLAGLNAARLIQGLELLHFPETAGALCHYISHADAEHFQPMKANFGLLPPLGMKRRMPKTEKAQLFSRRAWVDLEEFIAKADPLQ
jgi:methylenetetrahydrofolate--tRNA-(uracil-5-)-methyltransferase